MTGVDYQKPKDTSRDFRNKSMSPSQLQKADASL